MGAETGFGLRRRARLARYLARYHERILFGP